MEKKNNNLLNYKSNSFKNNFKSLTNHTKTVNHLSKLNDGRLISCGSDSLLNIYKKDSHELQLSIKEHSSCIYSFTQLKDGRIITCSCDNTMKIIKLIEEDKYQIVINNCSWIDFFAFRKEGIISSKKLKEYIISISSSLFVIFFFIDNKLKNKIKNFRIFYF